MKLLLRILHGRCVRRYCATRCAGTKVPANFNPSFTQNGLALRQYSERIRDKDDADAVKRRIPRTSDKHSATKMLGEGLLTRATDRTDVFCANSRRPDFGIRRIFRSSPRAGRPSWRPADRNTAEHVCFEENPSRR